jgi:hypothetical protein
MSIYFLWHLILQYISNITCFSTYFLFYLFKGRKVLEEYEETMMGASRIGSRPPRCEHKCGGCIPCNPIQIPTNKNHIGVQYANYEPEGWRCKCGTSYFSP